MARHDLPTAYREQIVEFILRNTAGGAALQPLPSINVDPFTGDTLVQKLTSSI